MSTHEALAVGSGPEVQPAAYRTVQAIAGTQKPDSSSPCENSVRSEVATVRGGVKETVIVYNSAEMHRSRVRDEIRRLLGS